MQITQSNFRINVQLMVKYFFTSTPNAFDSRLI